MNFKISIITMFLICSQSYCVPTYQHVAGSVFSQILGTEDVSSEQRILAYQALKDCGIKNPEDVVIKKMNKVGSSIVGLDLISFNMFGLWFNEEALAQESDAEKIFNTYHEAAHYALYHREKLLSWVVPLTVAGIYVTPKVAKHLLNFISKDRNVFVTLGAMIALTGMKLVAIDKLCLRPWVKAEELEADMYAARVLCRVAKRAVVESHLQSLKDVSDKNKEQPWHPQVEKTIAGLTRVLQENT